MLNKGNTAQSPPDGFARHLRAIFVRYCLKNIAKACQGELLPDRLFVVQQDL